MLYNGDIKILLARIQELPLKDIRIEEPSLDEIFMHYYE
jgi:ABC-2 type transport system ATP-binding protein